MSGTRPTWRVAIISLIGGAAMLVKFTVDGEESFDWMKFAMIVVTMTVTVGGVLVLVRYAREPEVEVDEQPAMRSPEEMRTSVRKRAITMIIAAFACSLALGWPLIAELNEHGAARPVQWAPYAILLLGSLGTGVNAARKLASDDDG